ncbi:MAG: SGNH/GDSL hydrolase family protein [Actinomycetota bacterium]|nr:SGNH/GDSL hydrolase family protein [Actinomycetota bacterium]
MLKRTVTSLALVLVSLGAILGVEIVIAARREYLPTEPALEIGGRWGPAAGRPLRLVVLGDSTAAGVGAGRPELSYPAQLAEQLGEDGYRVNLSALGMSGARTADVLREQVPRAEALDPDLVFVGIGANDAIHVTPMESVRRDIDAVLRRLRATGATVVVAGAPDMHIEAFLEPLRSLAAWRGRMVEDAITAVARAQRVPVVPLRAVAGPRFAAHPRLYNSPDELHPSAAGYGVWVDAIIPVIRKVLPPRRLDEGRG